MRKKKIYLLLLVPTLYFIGFTFEAVKRIVEGLRLSINEKFLVEVILTTLTTGFAVLLLYKNKKQYLEFSESFDSPPPVDDHKNDPDPS